MDNTPLNGFAIGKWRETLKQPREVEEDSDERATPLPIRVSQLVRFKAQEDKRCLLGSRFLCAGGAMLITGDTGVGKSSLIAQMAISFALGLDFFGIKPIGPLKSTIIQAENDDGDLAEEVQGVIRGTGVEDREDEIDRSVLFFEETIATGEQFADRLAALLSKYPCDLVFVDPLLAFLGGDVSRQDVVSKFLRNQINPVLKRTGTAMVLTHHAGKPSQNPLFKRSDKYGAIGSSEIQNWARAIMAVNAIDEGSGLFELVASKRGNRSGLLGGRAFIKHATHGIFWEKAEAPKPKEQNSQEKTIVLDRLKAGPAKHCDLVTLLAEQRSVTTRTAKRWIDAWFKERAIDKNDDGTYCLPTIYRCKGNLQ